MREVNIRLRKLEMELLLLVNFPQDLLLKHFILLKVQLNKKILLKQFLLPIQIFEGKRYGIMKKSAKWMTPCVLSL